MGLTADDTAHADLLAFLTGPQAEAVRHTDGPLLVLAGAGCGKTRVITHRAAYLARTVTRAHNILAITFTNKATNEMLERLVALGVGEAMTVCTFHSLCARLLRIHHARAGLPSDFTIFDSADQRRVIKDAIERESLSDANWTPMRVQAVISRAKNAMQTPEIFAEQAQDYGKRTIGRIYARYETILAEQHGLDFDDLLLRMAFLLREDAALRAELESRFTHVLIDEYQDTNAAQYEIAHLITERNHNLCATGDPDQSIYGWRGADINNILRFEEDFPEAKVVRLEQNYRSTRRILSAAGALISCNLARKEKTLWTENDDGAQVRVVTAADAESEARFVAAEIVKRRDQGESLSDIAVFYRLNSLSRAVEEALIQAGIPYQVARGTEFYNRKEIKDVLAYCRVLINPYDEVSLTRIINTPTRGIGKTTLDRLVAHARASGQPLFEVVAEPAQVSDVGSAAVRRLEAFVEILESIGCVVDARPRNALETIVMYTGLQAMLREEARHNREPLSNVEELISAAATFERSRPDASLRDWLEHTCLLGDVDAVEEDSGRMTLMTLHAAKGLEFPVVYMIGLEEGMLPFQRETEDETYDEEEERRLCFVGMTRSKRELILLHAKYRMMRGSSQRKVRSPFLAQLPAEEIEWVDVAGDPSDSAARGRGGRDLPADIERWEIGSLVRHPDYGLGKILWIHPDVRQTRLGVRFQSGAEQAFILQFSKLARVDFDEVGED